MTKTDHSFISSFPVSNELLLTGNNRQSQNG